jgi:hypothetical protein
LATIACCNSRKRAVGVGRDRLRLDDGEMLEREATAGAALSQRMLDPGDGQCVLGDARPGGEPLRRTESRSTIRRAHEE